MDKDQPKAIQSDNSQTIHIKSGSTTVEVVAHFIGNRTYEEVIKAALRREFSE